MGRHSTPRHAGSDFSVVPRVRVCEQVHKSADQALRAARSRSSETRQKSTWTPSTSTTGIESPYALKSRGSSVMSVSV